MPNDSYGQEIKQGDQVVIHASVLEVREDPNFLNCTVQLVNQMPPTGTETKLKLNTQQLEKDPQQAAQQAQQAQQAQSQQQQQQMSQMAQQVQQVAQMTKQLASAISS